MSTFTSLLSNPMSFWEWQLERIHGTWVIRCHDTFDNRALRDLLGIVGRSHNDGLSRFVWFAKDQPNSSPFSVAV
jgi:hypothetical protein